MNKYTKRVIKQLEDLYSKSDEAFLDWNAISEGFSEGKNKSEMMMQYGFSSYQYKILKNYMVGK